MNVRFQKTPRGEVAVLPRKEYEALDKAKSEGAHPEGDYMYAPQVTVDSERSLEVADKMIAHGFR